MSFSRVFAAYSGDVGVKGASVSVEDLNDSARDWKDWKDAEELGGAEVLFVDHVKYHYTSET